MSRLTRAGAGLIAAIALVALCAPLLAGNQPLVVLSGGGRIELPAARAFFRPLPATGPDRPSAPFAEGAWIVPPILGRDPLTIDLADRLRPPGPGHWLGTDDLGRDVLSRLIHATRPSLLVAGLATALSLLIGVPVGAFAGYGGRRTDLILSRLIEASLSFPALVLLLLFSVIALGTSTSTPSAVVAPELGLRSLIVVGCAVGVARWGVIARYMRGEVLRLAPTDLAQAARAAGAGPLRVLARHLVPAGIGPVAVSAAFGAGAAVVAEASLSFLGMGVQPPVPTWGQMIASAGTHGARHWWLLLFPGIMVAITVAAFNMIGEGLRRGRTSGNGSG